MVFNATFNNISATDSGQKYSNAPDFPYIFINLQFFFFYFEVNSCPILIIF
jgi:hypothetical protein